MANTETKVLYGGDVEITFYPDSHRYKKAGDKGWLTSVTAISGIIDKSRVLILWAVGLADSYMKKFFEENSSNQFSSEELLPIITEALNQHNVKRDEAADTGSQVHDMAQRIGEALRDNKSIIEITDEISELEKSLSNPDLTEEEIAKIQNVINGIQGFINWVVDHQVKFIECERMLYSRKHDYVGLTDAIIELDGKKYLIDYKTSKGVYSDMQYQLAAYTLAYEEETGEKLDGRALIHFDKLTGDFKVYEISEEDNLKNQNTFLACLIVKMREKELSKY